MAEIKLKCYYCGADVYRKRRIIASVCDDCKNKKENIRLYHVRREAMLNDKSGEVKKRILREHKKYRDDHDYADRTESLRPRKFWSEGEKLAVFERVSSDDALAKQYRVSVSAIRAVRGRMKNTQVVLLAEENKREIERRGGMDL